MIICSVIPTTSAASMDQFNGAYIRLRDETNALTGESLIRWEDPAPSLLAQIEALGGANYTEGEYLNR